MNIQWKSSRAHGTPFTAAAFLAALAVGMRFIILENADANGIGWADADAPVYLGVVYPQIFIPS